MPLKKGSSPETISKNISEFHTGDTYARTKAKFGKAKADKQAIAVAMSQARRGKAEGGNVIPLPIIPFGTAGPSADNPMEQVIRIMASPRTGNIKSIKTGNTIRADGGSIAMRLASKYGKAKASGGPNIESMVMRGSSIGMGRAGMIHSSIPGRTDKLPMNVKAGSYILPADIPSALGQGNTLAGGDILKKMFNAGPYGMQTMKSRGRPIQPRPPRIQRMMKQDGGEASDQQDNQDDVPIIAAGGEYIIDPEVVRDIGHGDIKAGHKVLDKFVLQVRNEHIKTLKQLPGPKR